MTAIVLFLLHVIECAIISPLESWAEINTPPIPIKESGWITGFDNDKIWLIGGFQSNHILYYSLTSLNFINTGDTLSFTGGLTPDSQSYTQLNSSIYFEHNSSLYKFDMDTGQLSSFTTAFPVSRNSPCIANDGRYIFLIGGGNCPNSGEELQVYDTITGEWRQGRRLSAGSGRAGASCAISPDNNFLYVFAGSYECSISSSTVLKSIGKISIADKTNIDTVSDNVVNTWAAIQDSANQINIMTSNFYYSRAITIGEYIYVIGGRDGSDNEAAEVMILDPSNDEIDYTISLPTARSSPGAIGVDGTIYIFGGSNGTDLSSWARSNIVTDAPTPSVCSLSKLNRFPLSISTQISYSNIANRFNIKSNE